MNTCIIFIYIDIYISTYHNYIYIYLCICWVDFFCRHCLHRAILIELPAAWSPIVITGLASVYACRFWLESFCGRRNTSYCVAKFCQWLYGDLMRTCDLIESSIECSLNGAKISVLIGCCSIGDAGILPSSCISFCFLLSLSLFLSPLSLALPLLLCLVLHVFLALCSNLSFFLSLCCSSAHSLFSLCFSCPTSISFCHQSSFILLALLTQSP